MEEKILLQVQIFNQTRHLSKSHFINFSQLVTKSHFNQIKIPFKTLDTQKIQVLNILLYYIISIQKNFKVFPQDHYGHTYRNHCTKSLSDYYIKNKFQIQEYQFAFLASKSLNMKLQQCAHIIYYLIYGRFASHPYINNLCGKKDYDFKRKLFKKGKQTAQNLKLLKKRTLNTNNNVHDFQFQNFKHQLKTALKSQSTNIFKKPFLQINTNKIKQNSDNSSIHATQRKSLIKGRNSNTFIPQRITQGQNSSIFQTLPFQRKSFQSCTDWNKKGLMRKQKFNQFFQINTNNLKNKLKKCPSAYFEGQNEINSRKILFMNNNDDQGSKINYQNFKAISNNLKSKNLNLDKIRTECSVRNHKLTLQKPMIENHIEINNKLILFNKQSILKQTNNQYIFNEIKNMQNLNELKLKRNFSSIDGAFIRQINLQKNMSYAPQQGNFRAVQIEEENEKQQNFGINLLRNDESDKQKENEQGKKIEYFSKSSSSGGFNKMNCKFKLQKYKSDYRKFMKSQLLDRIRQAS